jgi:hypothetical protein
VGGAAGTLSLNMSNANSWSALQTFSYASSTGFSTTYASSTNASFGFATSSIFALPALTSTLLKTNSLGQVSAAVAGTDYANFGYPFTVGNNYNTVTAATTSALFASGGLFASSTVVFGSAGNPQFYFDSSAGKLGLGTNPDTIFTVQIPNSSSDFSS